MKITDLRSDTVTQPTYTMRQAMLTAPVGDDVYGDDPTVNELEALAARVLGKEAALFVPSGTMGNQLAIMTHTRPGEEIILGQNSHIVMHERGSAGRLSGVNYAVVDNADTRIYPEDIRRHYKPGDLHCPHTSLLCLENALANGDLVPLEVMQADYALAKALGMQVHLDGARIFNAAVALGVEPRELAACADSVMFCVSKGLCAPVGSLLCGTREFIQRARLGRKTLGGAMRQAGILAACGIIAIQEMTKRLADDHDNARHLAQGLAKIPGVTADPAPVKINMVFWNHDKPDFDDERWAQAMLAQGFKVSGRMEGMYRFVTNNDVSREDIDRLLACLEDYLKAC